MRSPVLTDVHANREAFKGVLADAAKHGKDRLALPGVGDPRHCSPGRG